MPKAKECPKCHRPMNEGNSPNQYECTETDDDEGLCETYSIIFALTREYREVLNALEDASEACVLGHSQCAENLCHNWEDYETENLKEAEKFFI